MREVRGVRGLRLNCRRHPLFGTAQNTALAADHQGRRSPLGRCWPVYYRESVHHLLGVILGGFVFMTPGAASRPGAVPTRGGYFVRAEKADLGESRVCPRRSNGSTLRLTFVNHVQNHQLTLTT